MSKSSEEDCLDHGGGTLPAMARRSTPSESARPTRLFASTASPTSQERSQPFWPFHDCTTVDIPVTYCCLDAAPRSLSRSIRLGCCPADNYASLSLEAGR